MAIRIVWDEYETALLIDTFWQIEKSPDRKQELIKRLSDALRQKALKSGVTIDEKFKIVLPSPIDKPELEVVSKDIPYILKEHYQYGFKLDSFREILRFRQFAEADGVAIPEDDEDLKAAILSAGTLVDGKAFAKKPDQPTPNRYSSTFTYRTTSTSCVIPRYRTVFFLICP